MNSPQSFESLSCCLWGQFADAFAQLNQSQLKIASVSVMANTSLLKLLIAMILVLAICEVISALEPGNPGYRGSPQRRRNRHLQEPLELDEIDPEDPSTEVEERPPMTPEMMEHAATPKLVKGLNFAGDSTDFECLLMMLYTPRSTLLTSFY